MRYFIKYIGRLVDETGHTGLDVPFTINLDPPVSGMYELSDRQMDTFGFRIPYFIDDRIYALGPI